MPEAVDQQQMWTDHFAAVFNHSPLASKIWNFAGIATRHTVANPAVEDLSHWSTGQRMQRYQREALPLGIEAVERALANAGLAADQVGLLAIVSCTGYATPGLDIRISQELGMSPDVQRLVIGHMGCYAAVPGLGAVSDFVVARNKAAVMLCIELTSLHSQPVEAISSENPTKDDVEQMVAHAIFADAAAAIVLAPSPAPTQRAAGTSVIDIAPRPAAQAPAFEVVDVAAVTDWATQDLMRWDVTDLGFRMALSVEVPNVLAQHVCSAVDALLAKHGYSIDDVAGWAVHPGGRKILEVVQQRLSLPAGAMDASYSVLRDYGNCSSPTVLIVLEQLAATTDVPVGAPVVAMAFGPGLTLYSALLRRV
ncbi:MAG TPA: 3-oxoacyl-[acyl-carrier-protein] synthase III C-terminal domain-containing protein [Jatrophihabitans sp.]|nr:3-oxoacyl-[acyl-carrier-protein] synthase III C-terminal domain-containing protein [Jatrophihabitans sp.]